MSFKSLKVSIEEGVVEAGPALDPQEAAVADANLVADTSEVAEETAAMDDAQATVEEISESMDEVQDIAENVIEPAEQGEGMTQGEAASVEALFRSINRRCGLRSSRHSLTLPAKEQFGNKATRRQATRIAKESAWDKIKELWERFKTWLVQIWEKTKGWVTSALGITANLAEGFKKLKEQIEDDKNTQYRKAEYRDAKELDKMIIGADVRDAKMADVVNMMNSGVNVGMMEKLLKDVEKYMLNSLSVATRDIAPDPEIRGGASVNRSKEDLDKILNSSIGLGFVKLVDESKIRALSRDYRRPDTVDAPTDVTGYGILAGGKIMVIEVHNSQGKNNAHAYTTCRTITADENEGKRSFMNYTTFDLIKLCDIGYINAKKLSEKESVFGSVSESMKSAIGVVETSLKGKQVKAEASDSAVQMTSFNTLKSELKYCNDVMKDIVNIACSGSNTLLTHARALIANAWHKMEK